MPIQRNNTTTDNTSRQQSQARQGSVAAATPQDKNNKKNFLLPIPQVLALFLLGVLIFHLILFGNSYSQKLAKQTEMAEEIDWKSYNRYAKNFDQLNNRDRIALQIINYATSNTPSEIGHHRFAGRFFLRNFGGKTNTLKKFVDEDLVPYISRFAENTKQPAQECVHYLTREEKKDIKKFAAAVNPGEGFRGGCKFRVVVDEEVSENTWEINHAYKSLFETGYLNENTDGNPELFVNDGNMLLVIATTRFDKTDDFMHGRSTQMFEYRPNVGGMF